jgi:hypothetical protein
VLVVGFPSYVSADWALGIVEGIEGVRPKNVHKRSNEILIDIDPEDETIAGLLEKNPSVKYVAYLPKGDG